MLCKLFAFSFWPRLDISEDFQAGVQVGPDFVEVGAERDFDESLDQSFLQTGSVSFTLNEKTSKDKNVLKKFKSGSSFAKCILTNQELDDHKDAFSVIDRHGDGDGTIILEELQAAEIFDLSTRYVSTTTVYAFEMMDADGDSKIELNEWLFSKCTN